ncbi:FAD-dependent oxidoreductase [Sneathiella sp.]|uniref:FAD-dependent oxidoreductase n=1 Tax=Sneathiella sp. TaxID=1964365 RepID=UPI00356313DE
MRVLVVGAGPAGLTAAVELARLGAEVKIIDKRKTGSGLSRAVGITPESLMILTPSGVADKLIAEGVKFRGARIYRGASLALDLLIDIPRPKYGFDSILGLPQDRTETLLREALERFGVTINYSTELSGLRMEGNKVVAETADEVIDTVDYVIGADGVHSTTRGLLGLEFPGYELPETWSIADVDAKDWPNKVSFTLCQLADGKVVVAVPLEEGRYRIISNTENALASLPLTMNVTNIRREGQFDISVRQVKKYSRGRVFLVGDAAHCHSPVGGRGMNLGIGDSADLARRLINGDSEGYGAARSVVGRQTIEGSERIRKLVTSPNPLLRLSFRIGLKLISSVPALQRRIANLILYG